MSAIIHPKPIECLNKQKASKTDAKLDDVIHVTKLKIKNQISEHPKKSVGNLKMYHVMENFSLYNPSHDSTFSFWFRVEKSDFE